MGAAREKARVEEESRDRDRATSPSSLSQSRHHESPSNQLSPHNRKPWVDRERHLAECGQHDSASAPPVEVDNKQDVFLPPVPAGPKLHVSNQHISFLPISLIDNDFFIHQYGIFAWIIYNKTR